MSFLTEIDTVQTVENIYQAIERNLRMYHISDEVYIRNLVGYYVLLDTPKQRAEFRVDMMKRDKPLHRKLIQILDTFDSAELPDPEPPVKRKRGRPRKNQG